MLLNIRGLHHDHIDGSRAIFDVLDNLHVIVGKQCQFRSAEDIRVYFTNPLEKIVDKFSVVTGLMQTVEALEMVGYAYGKRRASEGYVYVEGKFAPQYHTFGGLSMKEVVAAMYRGLKKAEKDFLLTIVPVVCIGREATPEVGVEIAKIALEYDGEVALDLVCDEANHPPEKHLPAYKLTLGTKVKRDCHAGEWVSPEPAATYRARLLQNIRTAVYDLKCDGVGHAIPLIDDPDLISYIVDHRVRVSGNPLSNLVCGLIKDVRELRIDELLDRGVIYTLNPDDDLFLPPMDEVVAVCEKAYQFNFGQCRQLEDSVFRGSFESDVRA